MAAITINIPDAVIPRVIDAIAARQGYNPLTDGTKAAFAKKQVIRWAMGEVLAHETDAAVRSAYSAASVAATAEIVIT